MILISDCESYRAMIKSMAWLSDFGINDHIKANATVFITDLWLKRKNKKLRKKSHIVERLVINPGVRTGVKGSCTVNIRVLVVKIYTDFVSTKLASLLKWKNFNLRFFLFSNICPFLVEIKDTSIFVNPKARLQDLADTLKMWAKGPSSILLGNEKVEQVQLFPVKYSFFEVREIAKQMFLHVEFEGDQKPCGVCPNRH